MTRALRIVLLTETYAPQVGGAETQARLLAEGLAARGHRLLVVTRRTSRDLPRREVLLGVRVRRVGPVGSHHLLKWGLVGSVPPGALGALRSADVLFVSGLRVLGIPVRLTSLAARVPCVLKSDNNGELSGAFFERGLRRLRLRTDSAAVRIAIAARNRLLRGANAWVAISEDIATEYESHGVPAPRIHRIPNGVDTERFRPASEQDRAALRRRLGLPARAPVAIYTGRLVSYKGLPELLEAWRSVLRLHPDAILLLVGPGGLDIHNCEAELRGFVDLHEMAESVRFTGVVDAVEDYLRAADVFALPSRNEAFGLSLVEAMACGLPCVATPVGAMREIVRDGDSGLLVRAGDPEALARALADLLAGGPESLAMGARAAESVRGRFGANAVIGAYEDLFRRVSARVTAQEELA
ncbi:MAG: glycosyltransferase family 4 protein [Gemmatimonadota bacterium]